jgi:hypothetical protein
VTLSCLRIGDSNGGSHQVEPNTATIPTPRQPVKPSASQPHSRESRHSRHATLLVQSDDTEVCPRIARMVFVLNHKHARSSSVSMARTAHGSSRDSFHARQPRHHTALQSTLLELKLPMLKTPDEDLVVTIAAAFGIPAHSVTDLTRTVVQRCIAAATSRPQPHQGTAPTTDRAAPPKLQQLLIYTPTERADDDLVRAVARWLCEVTTCQSIDELQDRLRHGNFDLVLVAPARSLRHLLATAHEESTLDLSLAEMQELHVRRVLAAKALRETVTGNGSDRMAASIATSNMRRPPAPSCRSPGPSSSQSTP